MRYLLLLLIFVPAVDIGVLFIAGKSIGIFPTILFIIFTGILGTYLAKKQGLETIQKAREQLQNGYMPGDALIDGICILVGGVLLLLPGFITDAIGILLFIPFTRKFIKLILINKLKKQMENRTFRVIR
ncbi:FxsA family protein [Bacillus sp. 03113]|uniref:FxsA family protein n=1 Tax=Bacillus sp. 03113 TaxID=2578211 RepID=UPI0011414E08|nr:FxsA family protein [Bacillus sp. 03113]